MRNKWRQGIFTPKNQDKFIGSKAVYRSGLELKFFRFCDSNPNVIKWGSENIIVPYISPLDKRVHKYYVDNYIAIREGIVICRHPVNGAVMKLINIWLKLSLQNRPSHLQ